MPILQKINELKSFKNRGFTTLPGYVKDKIKWTTQYSLLDNPNQVKVQVIRRCYLAIVAEYELSLHLNGQMNCLTVNMEDPFTYTYDVIGGQEYGFPRIEVKTHQSGSKWIQVTTGKNGSFRSDSGINVAHFVSDKSKADFIAIYNVEKLKELGYRYSLAYAGDKTDFISRVKKSHYDGYYLNTFG